jgi:hypothetical protein
MAVSLFEQRAEFRRQLRALRLGKPLGAPQSPKNSACYSEQE